MKQSFYIFLCALLGILLFLLIQRSVFLLGYLIYGVAVLEDSWQMLDRWTFVVALFGGMWYGVWLGVTWYRMIYQDRSERGVISRMRSWFSPKTEAVAPTWNLQDLIAQQSSKFAGRGVEIFERDITVRTPLSAQALHSRTRRPAKKVVAKKSKKV